ncbi:hypothetical protein AMS68_004515 [Peltaster fructicola]|uniref:Vegetative cell wall protein gp1 n=1 Tax=Peltaster fructicola TaxID=286661 RepID=A0A6H0XWM4_9PEZI|nr:hypothetical protein AMS68_004515 [Peltaster fructicola]
MFQTQYPVPPPSYYPPDFQTPHTPGSARYQYYSPRQYAFTSPPAPKEHARRATQDYGYSYTTPKKSTYYTAEYSSPGYYSSTQQSSQRRKDYVPVYTQAESNPRQRRASYSSKPTYTSNRPRPSTATKPTRKATEEDARKHEIPAGYSYKNWDPSEEPILLLGSVFDANSLGKWIYDWTVFSHGPATPMSDLAGELWLLLIQLAGKMKSAEDALGSVRQQKNLDMIEDFIDSGERLWQRFNKLLKICENYMWKAAKRECGDSKRVTMGKTSGCEFVESIFGRDRELERTERLMTGIRLWALRYTANVDPILARPSA